MKILDAIKKLREISSKKNFLQSFELIINLKGIDTKKPENRFSEIVKLPYGKGENANIVVFSDSFKDLDAKIIGKKEIEEIAKEKRKAKELAKKFDFFLAEPQLMPIVGKHFGKFLAPRGKLPQLIKEDVKKMIEECKKSIRIRVKDSPVIQCAIGKESMKDEEISENAQTVINFLKEKLPRGKNNIEKIFLKLTMSKPIKVEKW